VNDRTVRRAAKPADSFPPGKRQGCLDAAVLRQARRHPMKLANILPKLVIGALILILLSFLIKP